MNTPPDPTDQLLWVRHFKVGTNDDGSKDYTVCFSDWPSQYIVRLALDKHDTNWRENHRLVADSRLLGRLHENVVLHSFVPSLFNGSAPKATEFHPLRIGTQEGTVKICGMEFFHQPLLLLQPPERTYYTFRLK